MNIRDCAWLGVLADYGHMTDAAAALGTSQPTLSRALRRMEGELGTPLFVRSAHGMELTPMGRLAATAARDISSRYDELVDDIASALDPETGTVRLAFLDSIATSLVPRVLRSYHALAPRARVLLRQGSALEVVTALENGSVELAITTVPPSGDYGWHELQAERLVLIVPPTHRWRERQSVDLGDLRDEELVTTPVGLGYRVLVDQLLRDAQVSPRISFESQDLATIEGLVAAGLGVAIVPEAFAGQSGTVGLSIDGPAAHRSIGLAWRTDLSLPAPASRFLRLVTGELG